MAAALHEICKHEKIKERFYFRQSLHIVIEEAVVRYKRKCSDAAAVPFLDEGEKAMEEHTYSVSEAVRLVGVESHVLRYWEEELAVPVGRSAQGHRMYSEDNIRLFGCVKQWKENGLQLKAIRLLLGQSAGAAMEPQEQLQEFARRLRGEGEKKAPKDGSMAKAYAPGEAKNRGMAKAYALEEAKGGSMAKAYALGDVKDGSMAEAYLAGEAKDGSMAEPYLAGEPERVYETDQVSESGEAVRREAAETDVQTQQVCEIIPASAGSGELEKAVLLLRRMMESVMEEQNRKLEEQMMRQIRDELEACCIQYIQAVREAAAEKQPEKGLRERFFALLARLFSGKR